MKYSLVGEGYNVELYHNFKDLFNRLDGNGFFIEDCDAPVPFNKKNLRFAVNNMITINISVDEDSDWVYKITVHE